MLEMSVSIFHQKVRFRQTDYIQSSLCALRCMTLSVATLCYVQLVPIKTAENPFDKAKQSYFELT